MGYETERALVETAFATGWANTTPVQYGNVVFDAPETGPWVSLNLLYGPAVNASVGAPGANIVRHVAVLAVQVHVPKGSGTVGFTGMFDTIESIFRNRTIENIRFMVPYPSGQAIEAGAFTSRTMMCPFTRDEFNG